MKLKRLLSGVTAAIMALSSVAIASFTSVSASELADKATIQWTGKWLRGDGGVTEDDPTGLIDAGTSKGGLKVENWGSGWQLRISGFSLEGIKNPTIEVEISDGGVFQVFNEVPRKEGEGTKPDVNFGVGKTGESVLIPENYRNETAFLLATQDGLGTITKISIYDDPNPPVQPIAFESITYNFTVTSGGNTTVTFTDGTNKASIEVADKGDYTLKRVLPSPQLYVSQLGYIEGDPVTTVKVNTILINEKYKFEVNREIISDGSSNNALPQMWDGVTPKTPVIYQCEDAYISGSSKGISLMPGTPPEVDNTDSSSTPSPNKGYTGTTYRAYLGYFSSGRDMNHINSKDETDQKTYGGPIGANGTYTLGLKVSDLATWPNPVAKGITCLYVDIVGFAEAIGASVVKKDAQGNDIPLTDGSEAAAMALARKAGLNITNLSILTDGEVFYQYKDSEIMFGDVEGNGNMRIDIFNQWNESGDGVEEGYEAPEGLKNNKLLFEASDKIEVKFTWTYNDPNAKKPTAKPTTTPTTNKVDAAKKAAEAKVKNAKIKNLTVKSKAKKKISVSWKKVSKVNGYQVQVAKKKDFKGKNIILKKFTKKAKLTVKSPKIKSKKAYFVRVRAYATYKNAKNKATKVYGKFSAKKKVKVK